MNNDTDHTKRINHWIQEGKRLVSDRLRRIERTKNWKFDTIATHGLYDMEQALKLNNASMMEPIFMSSAQAFHDSAEVEAAFVNQIPSWIYTRIANPSTRFLEETVALLETYQPHSRKTELAHRTDLQANCVACSSGMAAIRSAIEPFLIRQDSLPPPNIVTSSRIYGGTFQQFSVRQMQDRGIEVRWITDNIDMDEWESKVDRGTRFLYGEMPSNPSVHLFDIEKVAELAHSHGMPLIVDATCASPALLRPLTFGADIVVQSASKVMGASGMGIVGTLTAKMNIPSRVGPDEMKEDFAAWVKLLPYRDNGPALSPMNAILTLNDLRSLRSRVAQMSRSALKVAQFLEDHPKIASVSYPGLKNHPQAMIADKYLTLVDSEDDTGKPEHLYGFMMMFQVKEDSDGDSYKTRQFYDALSLIWKATDLGKVKSIATIPAISTHQQQGEAGRALASILPSHVRLSIGIEHVDDIIADLSQALDAIDRNVTVGVLEEMDKYAG